MTEQDRAEFEAWFAHFQTSEGEYLVCEESAKRGWQACAQLRDARKCEAVYQATNINDKKHWRDYSKEDYEKYSNADNVLTRVLYASPPLTYKDGLERKIRMNELVNRFHAAIAETTECYINNTANKEQIDKWQVLIKDQAHRIGELEEKLARFEELIPAIRALLQEEK